MHTDNVRGNCVQGWRRGFTCIATLLLALMLFVPASVIYAKGSKGGGGDGRGAGSGGGGNHASSSHSSGGSQSGGHDSGHDSGSDGGHDSHDSGGHDSGHEESVTGSGSSSGSKGMSGNSGSGKGGSSRSSVSLSSDSDSDGDDDSDKPAWAGRDGDHTQKPGGGNHGKDTQKGEDYGDLFVMLRDDSGDLIYVTDTGDVCKDSNDCYPVAVIFNDTGEIVDYFILEDDVDPPATVEEIELGRLNIARAPSKVLEHALSEAMTKLDGTVVTEVNWFEVTDYSGRLLIGEDLAIDSPLENLALYQAVLDAYDEGWHTINDVSYLQVKIGDLTLTVEQAVVPQLAAAMLAAASDKTGTLSVDEVAYISKFLDVDDELSMMVVDFEKYENWYDPEKLYDVSFNVVVIDPADGPKIVEVNLFEDVDFNTISPTDEFTQFGNILLDNPSVGDLSIGLDVFTQAADDSVQVLEFVHDSFFP